MIDIQECSINVQWLSCLLFSESHHKKMKMHSKFCSGKYMVAAGKAVTPVIQPSVFAITPSSVGTNVTSKNFGVLRRPVPQLRIQNQAC